jgi:hypothetical protein
MTYVGLPSRQLSDSWEQAQKFREKHTESLKEKPPGRNLTAAKRCGAPPRCSHSMGGAFGLEAEPRLQLNGTPRECVGSLTERLIVGVDIR